MCAPEPVALAELVTADEQPFVLEPAPFLGDAWFYRSLSILGTGDNRLVETEEGRPLPPAPPLRDPETARLVA